MGQELYWIYGFNVIVNSALSFFTAAILIELLVRLLRILHPRAQVICRLLPFCKLCIDLFRYHFSNWALLHQVNPILAETGTRQLSVVVDPLMGIGFSMQDGKTFSVADVIALSVDPFWVRATVCVAIVGTAIACALYLIRIFRGKRSIDLIVKSSIPIRHLNVCCAITSLVEAPCIVGKTILFPARLIETLSPEEFAAIIAHETAHFQWRDCGLRLILSMVAALFWWIPTGWWRKRIEEMQEQAADSAIHRLGISKFALAEAIVKTARAARASELAFSFVERTSSLSNRMQMILQEPVKRSVRVRAVQYGLLGVCLLSILFGRLWIF